MAITKAVLTYTDGSEAVFTGDNVDLSTLPTMSPAEQEAAAQAAQALADAGAVDHTIPEPVVAPVDATPAPVEAPVEPVPAETPVEPAPVDLTAGLTPIQPEAPVEVHVHDGEVIDVIVDEAIEPQG